MPWAYVISDVKDNSGDYFQRLFKFEALTFRSSSLWNLSTPNSMEL